MKSLAHAVERTGGKLVLACNAAMVVLTPLASVVAGNPVAKLAGAATVLARGLWLHQPRAHSCARAQARARTRYVP